MADKHRVPASASENPERIQERPYESDFARLPESETQPHSGPGGGPEGPVAAVSNLPIVVMAFGALVAFGVFLVRTPWMLGIGLALVVGGAIWAGVRTPQPGSGAGLGPTAVEDGTTPTGASHEQAGGEERGATTAAGGGEGATTAADGATEHEDEDRNA